jgi:hypothetical protein
MHKAIENTIVENLGSIKTICANVKKRKQVSDNQHGIEIHTHYLSPQYCNTQKTQGYSSIGIVLLVKTSTSNRGFQENTADST